MERRDLNPFTLGYVDGYDREFECTYRVDHNGIRVEKGVHLKRLASMAMPFKYFQAMDYFYTNVKPLFHE